ncbi:rho guanine nucleotide exchange factor 25 isoform X3 [Eurytemora carolleeae]|uniref:rho guanine nucleotide exchange factor 25 isoform X3 n=1 Tax=Eurytemora carolleeae TaxID=1294199 RepID=UPI000C78B197|nr:rho guanine nucleotide exchange factor 25 isoform X3 [Eurytemora carolleeae]|eukprot:XP_023326196.1 rho guanine nucleotide exchange factor 25-like isoform X3 [Eurytemora affinis]
MSSRASYESNTSLTRTHRRPNVDSLGEEIERISSEVEGVERIEEVDRSRHSAYHILRKNVRRATSTIRSMVSDRGSTDDDLDNNMFLQQELTEEEVRKRQEAFEAMSRKLNEFMDLEKKHLEHLEKIVEFLSAVELAKDDKFIVTMPKDLKTRYKIVFGNIISIRDFHKNGFTQSLVSALGNPVELTHLFKKRQQRIKELYSKYYINKPRSDYVLNEFSDFFQEMEQVQQFESIGFRYDSELTVPVQHLQRYPILLEGLISSSKQAGELEYMEYFTQVYKICHDISITANSMMEAGRIQNLEFDITSQGTLVHRGTVRCKENGKKKTFPEIFKKNKDSSFDAHVFFFDQCIIITEFTPRKVSTSEDEYKFLRRFNTNHLTVKDEGKSKKSFEIYDTDDRVSLSVICTDDEEKMIWLQKINETLKSLERIGDTLTNPGAF